MKWIGVLCAIGASASAEPRIYGEGGVAVGVPGGVPQHTNTGVGAMFDLGVTVAPHVSLVFGYRDLGDIAEQPGNPNSLNNATATISYTEWMFGGRFAWPVVSHLAVFGELGMLVGRTDIADVDFAGGDDEVDWHVGAAVRAGAVVDLDLGGLRFGLGAAASFRATPHHGCEPAELDCVQRWTSVDVFLRVAY